MWGLATYVGVMGLVGGVGVEGMGVGVKGGRGVERGRGLGGAVAGRETVGRGLGGRALVERGRVWEGEGWEMGDLGEEGLGAEDPELRVLQETKPETRGLVRTHV